MQRSELFDLAQNLGATLYMPVINPHAGEVLRGANFHDAGSVVICLEDALHEKDIGRGMDTLRERLLERAAADLSHQRTMVFIRPRNLAMAHMIAGMKGIETVSGLIVPKMTISNGPGWFELARDHGLKLMPTFETADYFDPIYVSDAKRMIDAEGDGHVLAIRLGGNDLLNTLGLRRIPGLVSHEGPLSYVLGMIGSQFLAGGYAVAAPVYDIIHDLDTLAREVGMDVQRGFIGKTAIHPCQIRVIHDALRPAAEDIEMAQAILDESAAAVFQIRGVMCEPATHRGWARHVLLKAARWGVAGPCSVGGTSTALLHESVSFRALKKIAQ